MKFKLLSIFFLLLIIIPSALAVDYPSRDGNVNDFADMLDPDEEAQLNSDITSLEQGTTIEIVIVTVGSLQGVSIEEYAVNLFEKWGVGKKGKDNGLLILVAKNEREYRTEVGYGLEGIITDAESSRIGHSILEPNFKNGEYGRGLQEAVAEIRGIVENEPKSAAEIGKSAVSNVVPVEKGPTHEKELITDKTELPIWTFITLIILALIGYNLNKNKGLGIILASFVIILLVDHFTSLGIFQIAVIVGAFTAHHSINTPFNNYRVENMKAWSILLGITAIALIAAYLTHPNYMAILIIILFAVDSSILFKFYKNEKMKAWIIWLTSMVVVFIITYFIGFLLPSITGITCIFIASYFLSKQYESNKIRAWGIRWGGFVVVLIIAYINFPRDAFYVLLISWFILSNHGNSGGHDHGGHSGGFGGSGGGRSGGGGHSGKW